MRFETLQKYRISAVEPFGAVVQAIPVLKAGLDLLLAGYAKTELAINKRMYVEKLSYQLLLQHRMVEETVCHIIMESSPDVDKTLLEKDPVAYFENKSIQAKVEDFLKPENYKALAGNLRGMQRILEEVAGHLDGLIPSHKDNPNDLIGIIEANQTAKQHRPDFIPRLKVALDSGDMKRSIKELEKATGTLLGFSQLVIANRHRSVNSQQPSNAVKLAKAFRQIQKSSKNLYEAFRRCCIGCHSEHDVHVLLEDRTDVASKLLLSRKQRNEEDEAVLAFQLIFSAKALPPAQTRYHELSVRCMQEDESADSLHTELSRVTFSEVESVISSDPGFVLVSDFCAAIATAHDGAPHVAFILHSRKGMGFVTAEEKTIMQKDFCQTITLKDVISTTSPSNGEKLPLKSRMMLASKLASSLLQFSQTRWHSQTLSKGSIFFLLHPKFNDAAAPLTDFERPFVCGKMDDGEVNGEETIKPKSILLELGILLLEIWYQTGLEDRFADKTQLMSGNSYIRLALAAEWLDDKYDPAPALYEDAVRYCIHGGSTKDWTDWGAIELWREICERVVEPLSKNCAQWRKDTVSNGV